jgi:hypothetical protein
MRLGPQYPLLNYNQQFTGQQQQQQRLPSQQPGIQNGKALVYKKDRSSDLTRTILEDLSDIHSFSFEHLDNESL